MNNIISLKTFILVALFFSVVAKASTCEKENRDFNIAINESFKCGD